MMRQRGQHPNEVKVIGAKKLQNGGVVYELNNPEAASWLRQEKPNFTKIFGESAVIKDKTTMVIAEYVPIAHNPNALGEYRKIKQESGLSPESIASTGWIKLVTRRVAGQRTAHLIIRLRSPEVANQTIRDGLINAGKRTWARKMKKRAQKCQVMGANHLAAECDKPTACGTCGKEHRTAECSEEDQTKFWCANCKTHRHAPWD